MKHIDRALDIVCLVLWALVFLMFFAIAIFR